VTTRASRLSFRNVANATREDLQRFVEPPPLTDRATIRDAARHRLRTRAGRRIYGQRKATIEPAFGIIKSAIGFRQFLLRGIDKVRGEWKIIATAYNLKRLHTLRRAML